MVVELLKIVYPDRYPICGECKAALALAARIKTSSISQIAAQNSMELGSWLQIHCNDWIDSVTRVPDPTLQTAMQAQIKDSNSVVGLTDPKVVTCPGKASRLSSQLHQLPDG